MRSGRILGYIAVTSPHPDAPLRVEKRNQQFILAYNKPLSVVAMRIDNPDCSPLRIQGGDTTPTPTGFAEIVSDNFPILHG